METTTDNDTQNDDTRHAVGPGADTGLRHLRRARDGRMVAGVAAGLAAYFDVDVTVVRLLIVAATVIGGAGIPLYVAAWLLIPEDGADEPLASELARRVRSR
ncbi:MAG TPA: PspC domain-containing protein [Acidimicrobiales bacterium]|nr:PspC domain-containing protein [Acidimicrobiales bacterium]